MSNLDSGELQPTCDGHGEDGSGGDGTANARLDPATGAERLVWRVWIVLFVLRVPTVHIGHISIFVSNKPNVK